MAADARPREWLGATAVGSQDPVLPRLLRSAAAMCDHYPQLHFLVNFYDPPQRQFDATALVREHTPGGSAVEATRVSGMKTLFWKRVLTPEFLRARGVQLVWLVDSDISIHPSSFPLGQ